jgi:hypothetical protein
LGWGETWWGYHFCNHSHKIVIPAKAGIQLSTSEQLTSGIPAFAGMTEVGVREVHLGSNAVSQTSNPSAQQKTGHTDRFLNA